MKFRSTLSAPGLMKTLRTNFSQITDIRNPAKITHKLDDVLMSAHALFALKYPSLLQFDRECRGDEIRKANLCSIFGLSSVVSDTQMRTILDEVHPSQLHRCLDALISSLQQAKVLHSFEYIDERLLVAADGTGVFSSEHISCVNCCTAEHTPQKVKVTAAERKIAKVNGTIAESKTAKVKVTSAERKTAKAIITTADDASTKGKITNYHQILAMVIVHPERKHVFPICLEAIVCQDGAKKNDCELNAFKRGVIKLKNKHPHLKMRLLLDGLFPKATVIRLLREKDLGFIIVAKDNDHVFLQDYMRAAKDIGDAGYMTCTTLFKKVNNSKGILVKHEFYFANNVPLNASNQDVLVNVIEYIETIGDKSRKWVWITDIELNKLNVFSVMRAGRARWKIENETFGVLKNTNHNFEHNFGHGYKYLCENMATIMMTAFLSDQIQGLECPVFKCLLKLTKAIKYLWEDVRGTFRMILCSDIKDFFLYIGRHYDKKFAIDH